VFRIFIYCRTEYEDWLVIVGAVLQPVPLCPGAMSCPRVAQRLGRAVGALARDVRCGAHGSVAPCRAARPSPPSWLRVAAPSDPLLALSNQQLCQLWGDMVRTISDNYRSVFHRHHPMWRLLGYRSSFWIHNENGLTHYAGQVGLC
jgi:hypothetical protein